MACELYVRADTSLDALNGHMKVRREQKVVQEMRK